MMKGGTAKEEYQPGFEQWFQYIEKAFAEKEAGLPHYPSDSEWASQQWANAVTDTIIESVNERFSDPSIELLSFVQRSTLCML